jgi:hypothetical protein
MQLLPSMGYAKADLVKGKRKVTDEIDGDLQTKKAQVMSGEDKRMEVLGMVPP